VLNDEFVAGHIGLVPAHLPHSHSLQYVHASSAIAMLLVSAFFETNILQGSVATPFRCGICNEILLQISC